MIPWITIAATLVVVQIATAEEKPKTDGLVTHYTFDEGSGMVLADKTGNKNDGKITGSAEWVKVGDGHALKFDGKTTYVDCGAGKTLAIESAGTVACWFNPDAELQGGLVTRSTSGSWPDERLVISLRTPGGTLVWSLADGKNAQFRQHEGTKPATWTHVAVTFDGVSAVCYRDGRCIWAEAQEVTPRIKDVPLIIGRSQGLGEEYFKGLIDEVRIYNRALTGQEIQDLHAATKR